MVVRKKGWRIHGKVCEEWNNVFIFVCDCNEKMVERLNVYLCYILILLKSVEGRVVGDITNKLVPLKRYLCISFKTLCNETYHLVTSREINCWLP